MDPVPSLERVPDRAVSRLRHSFVGEDCDGWLRDGANGIRAYSILATLGERRAHANDLHTTFARQRIDARGERGFVPGDTHDVAATRKAASPGIGRLRSHADPVPSREQLVGEPWCAVALGREEVGRRRALAAHDAAADIHREQFATNATRTLLRLRKRWLLGGQRQHVSVGGAHVVRPVRLDTERHRQRPRGDVVELVLFPVRLFPATLVAPELLHLQARELGIECVRGLEDRLRDLALRLREVDDVGARLEPAGADRIVVIGVRRPDREWRREPPHLDARAHEGARQLGGATGVGARHEDHPAQGRRAPVSHRAQPKAQVVPHALARSARGGLDGGERRHVVLRDAVAQGDKRSIRTAPQHAAMPPAIGLERHADGPVQRGPRVVVARVVEVEDIARVVHPPVPVEGPRVASAQDLEPLVRVRADVRVHRSRRGGKEVARDMAVQVGGDHWMPLQHHPHDALHLALRAGDQVAVHVEPVVVESALHAPRLAVFLRLRLRVRHVDRVVPHGEPLVAVRVGAGVDDHHGVLQRGERRRLFAGRELVEQLHCGFEAGRLVAVHRAGDPDHGRRARRHRVEFRLRGAARVGQPVEVRADRVEATDVLGRRHEVDPHRPALVRGGELLHAHPVLRRVGDGEQHLLLRGVLGVHLPDRVAEDALGLRHRRAVGTAIVEAEVRVIAGDVAHRHSLGAGNGGERNERGERHRHPGGESHQSCVVSREREGTAGQNSIWAPSSTTRLGGIWKNSVAERALRDISAKIRFRQRAMWARFAITSRSRPR